MDLAPKKETVLRWALACGAFAVLLFFFSPAWSSFAAWARLPEMQNLLEVRRGASVLQQAENPGAAIQDPLHAAIQWRLLFPVLGGVFSMPPWLLFGLAPLGCLFVLAFAASLLREKGWAWSECFAAILVLGSASWFLSSTGWLGYYDSWLVFALLVLSFSSRPWALWLACLLGPWIDERFVLGAGLAFLLRFAAEGEEARRDAAGTRSRLGVYGASGALVILFVAVRLALLSSFSAPGATVGGYLATQHNFQAPPERILLGVWEGLRLAWIPASAFFFFAKVSRSRLYALAGYALLLVLVGLWTAQDFSRSMSLLVPLAFAGMLSLPTSETRRAWESWALRAAAAAALLLPAHHVMSDRVVPIFYLHHELAALETPPPILSSKLYELDGIDAMEQGDFARAESRLTIAIRLSENETGAAKHRGLLYAGAGRWREARDDFSLMIERAPTNQEGWFLRAQANFALGDRNAAGEDFRQAMKISPQDWSRRPDVSRFAARLAQGK